MTFPETLTERNSAFAAGNGFHPALKMMPSRRTLILGCVDPRVDPMDVLQLQPGEAAVIRNVGGRVNPALLDTLGVLRAVSRVGGAEMGPDWHLVLLHHTHCGISGCYHHAPALLARQMGVAESELANLAIDDPYTAVKIDIAALRASPEVSANMALTGMVYDVATGRVETVVAA